MKKLIALILIVIFVFSLCGCESIDYKEVTFSHYDILDKEVVFAIPNSWLYAEICDGDDLIEFRDERGHQFGNVTLNTLYLGEDDVYSVKENIVPIEEAKYTKISEECFITTDKGRGNIITYKITDKAIDIFFDITVEKSVVKQIAKNITVKDFEITDNKDEIASPSPSSSANPSNNIIINQKPDISFIEEPGLINNAISVNKIYDVYNAVGCVMHLMGRPNIGKEIYFENNYNTSTLQLYGDDGYIYMLIDNFRSSKFELAKLSEPGRSANIRNRDVILSKSLPAECTLLTEYNEYMYNFASQRSFINFEQADMIIMTSDLCQLLNEDSLMPDGISVSEDGMTVSTKFYIPEAMAFLYITENFREMQAKYTIAAINGDTSHLPQSLMKYNTTKEMYYPANKENYKKFGVIFP